VLAFPSRWPPRGIPSFLKTRQKPKGYGWLHLWPFIIVVRPVPSEMSDPIRALAHFTSGNEINLLGGRWSGALAMH
jgi:hypothetical protein